MNVEIYDDPVRLADLKPQWERLLAEAPVYSGAQAYYYAELGWRMLEKTPDIRLAVVTVWRDGELECVWPLYVRREGVRTIATHLGVGNFHEYAGPLARGDENAAEALRMALQAAKGLADLLMVYSLPVPSLGAEVLRQDGGRKHLVTIGSPVITLKGFPDWEAWLMSKSKNFRAALRNDPRRLARLGEIQFREMAGPVDGPRCVDWIFDSKRRWAGRKGIDKSWILEDLGDRFYTDLAARTPDQRPALGDTEFHALLLDDKIIAAGIGMRSSHRIEYYVSAFDYDYADYSPGNLFIQEYASRALQDGVDFDFRITHDAYKLRWIDRYDRFDSFYFACTPLGHVALTVMQTQLGVRAFRAKYGPIVKGKIRQWLARAKGRPSKPA